MMIKFVYSAVWQEEIVLDPRLLEPEVNEKGADLLPQINALANSFSQYPVYDQQFQVINKLIN